jgi:predicted PurR-regulated permease PerM
MQRTVEYFIANPHNPIFDRLPHSMQSYVQKLPGQVTHELQQHAAAYTTRVLNALIAIVAIAGVAVAIPVVSIYMLAESAVIKRFFVRAFPPRVRSEVVDILGDVDNVIGGFIRGQVIVAAVVGSLAMIALLLIGVPYAVLIGAWAGIADVIPYIGPFAGAIPAAIVAILNKGVGSLLWVVIAFTAINQLEGHLLGPRIVSSTVKVTPLAVIFALLIGAHLFGFAGLVVAVPLAGVIRVLLVRLLPDREVTNAELRPGLTQPPKTEVDPTATEA